MKLVLTMIAMLGLSLNASAAKGDAKKGKMKAMTCVACHGAKGISMQPKYPNLAGQKEMYLLNQLKAFKSGARKNVEMQPMIAMLKPADLPNVAAYFASMKPTAGKKAKIKGDPKKGKMKAMTCVACHGPKGISLQPKYPNLAGQKELYILNQLKAFKSGARKNAEMAPMIKLLKPADLPHVAAYFASLPKK